MNFLSELNRRKVFKVGAAYLVVAWLMAQAASIGFPAFALPATGPGQTYHPGAFQSTLSSSSKSWDASR